MPPTVILLLSVFPILRAAPDLFLAKDEDDQHHIIKTEKGEEDDGELNVKNNPFNHFFQWMKKH